MTLSKLAFLLGVLAPPLALLAMGHAYRLRSEWERKVFWGAVLGYGVGILVTVVAMHAPPVAWSEGVGLRQVAVHWGLLTGAVAGAGVGAARGLRPSSPSDDGPLSG